jgi:hypothetical protein
MLQNRVDPLGNIIRTSARGAWMGNRGLLHDNGTSILRPYKLRAWLICLLEFSGRKRMVMSPRMYTELFFMDEATALSAGHRPCYECRRKDFDLFKSSWLKGNPEYGFTMRTPISELDDVLHLERIDKKGSKIMHEEAMSDLPDGVIALYAGKPCLVAGGRLFPWSPGGYGEGFSAAGIGEVWVLTPRSTVNAFRGGYVPQIRRP